MEEAKWLDVDCGASSCAVCRCRRGSAGLCRSSCWRSSGGAGSCRSVKPQSAASHPHSTHRPACLLAAGRSPPYIYSHAPHPHTSRFNGERLTCGPCPSLPWLQALNLKLLRELQSAQQALSSVTSSKGGAGAPPLRKGSRGVVVRLPSKALIEIDPPAPPQQPTPSSPDDSQGPEERD